MSQNARQALGCRCAVGIDQTQHRFQFRANGGGQRLNTNLLALPRLEAEPVQVAGLVDGAHHRDGKNDLLSGFRRVVRLRLMYGGEAIDDERLRRALAGLVLDAEAVRAGGV